MRTLLVCLGLLCAIAPSAVWAQDQPKPQPPSAPAAPAAQAAPAPAPAPAPAQAPASDNAKPKVLSVAFFQLEAQHVDPKTASIISDELLVLLSKMPGSNVMGSREVDAMLGYEQKKQMSGCTDTSCMVAIGGALGVDKILMGSLGKLGESYILNLKLLDIRAGKVEQLYSNRLRGGKEEDFLDILPEALASVFPASASTWVKTNKPDKKQTEQFQVVDLQRTPGSIKLPEQKPDDVPPAKAMLQKAEEPKAVAKAEVKAEPKKEEPAGPYSHDEQVFIAVKGNGTVVPAVGSSVEVHIGYAFSKWFELSGGGDLRLGERRRLARHDLRLQPGWGREAVHRVARAGDGDV